MCYSLLLCSWMFLILMTSNQMKPNKYDYLFSPARFLPLIVCVKKSRGIHVYVDHVHFVESETILL